MEGALNHPGWWLPCLSSTLVPFATPHAPGAEEALLQSMRMRDP